MNTISKSFLRLVPVILVLAAVGCNKKQPPQAVGPADTAANTTTATAAAQPALVLNPVAIPPEAAAGDTSQITAALTQALRRYAVERKGMPRNFSELVSAGYVKNVPAAPPGKKFEIDAQTARVVLVNQ